MSHKACFDVYSFHYPFFCLVQKVMNFDVYILLPLAYLWEELLGFDHKL